MSCGRDLKPKKCSAYKADAKFSRIVTAIKVDIAVSHLLPLLLSLAGVTVVAVTGTTVVSVFLLFQCPWGAPS